MTRAQIAEALETVPLDTVILGSRTGSKLTAKQKEFARNLALGKSKAQAYRESHNSKGTKKTQANAGYRLSQLSDIQAIKEAYEVAIEAAKQRTPAQLRELVIHQLTQIAIGGEKEAQRIQALKLLGQVTEVAAFTERRETTTIRKSEDVRAALMEKLRTISGSASDAVYTEKGKDADSLLKEIAQGRLDNAEENAQPVPTDAPDDSDPTLPAPPDQPSDHPSTYLHSIPHSQTPSKSVAGDDTDNPDISDGELIGLDVHTSLCIKKIEPIVADKDPAENPTPSDIETPPGAFAGEK